MRDDEYLRLVNSTIVRSGPRPRGWARAAGTVLSAIAPPLAARLAARWFLTPPRARRAAWEVRALATARSRVVDVDGRRVQTWAWGLGPAVLLVHGWGGRGGQLAAFVEPLRARGFSVVAFDAPAHGDSDGRQVTIPEMVTALRAVATTHAPIHGIVAHSVGAVATARALYEGLAAGPLVFIGAPAEVITPSVRFGDALGLSRRVRELMQRRIERRVGMPWAAFDLARLAQTSPLLVVHDRDDGEIAWQHGVVVSRAWPGAELMTTGGLGHRRILRDPATVDAVAAFIAAHTPSTRMPALVPAIDDAWEPDELGERIANGILV